MIEPKDIIERYAAALRVKRKRDVRIDGLEYPDGGARAALTLGGVAGGMCFIAVIQSPDDDDLYTVSTPGYTTSVSKTGEGLDEFLLQGTR